MNYILRDLSQDKEYQKFNDFCKKNYSDNNKIKSPITLKPEKETFYTNLPTKQISNGLIC